MTFERVYILCPYRTSGGPEGLHMLCHAINEQGGNASMVYYDKFMLNGQPKIHYGLAHNNPPHSDFNRYNLQITETVTKPESIINDPSSAMIIPEHADTYAAYDVAPLATKFLWWLATIETCHLKHPGIHNVVHLCDCFAAAEILMRHGIYRFSILQYYLAEPFLDVPSVEKEDIVTYNPARMTPELLEFMDTNSDLCFVPVGSIPGSKKWLNREQVSHILSRSKVYLDFGDFRGRENIPKEACVLNNCVIVNRRGAARFFGDVPLPEQYKCSDQKQVRELILECFQNYTVKLKDFEMSRHVLRNQKSVFYAQVKQLFC